MNEEQVKRILKADQESQSAYDAALEQAHTVPIMAAQRVEALLARVKESAETEAIKIIMDASGSGTNLDAEETQHQEFRRMEVLAKSNHDKAVKFVLRKLIGANSNSE